MSVKEFSEVIQSQVFKGWLSKLDKNIVNATVGDIRAKEQIASKTDFILSVKNVKEMYKSVTSKEMSNSIARRVLRDIASAGKLDVPAKVLRLNGSGAIFFESIGFDTISKYVTSVFDNLSGVQEAYSEAREKYVLEKTAELNSKTFERNGKQTALDKIDVAAKNIGFGYFLHKGHVVSLATNSAKGFRDSIQDATEITEQQKSLLISVLDKYISKLQKDDLASANLPNAHTQSIYAKYIKSSEKYLVEIQLKSDNLASGSASLPITNELRKVFSTSGKELENIMLGASKLGRKLVETKGSPSMLDLIVLDLASIITGNKKNAKTYTLSSTEIGKSTRKILKPSNKKEIASLKKLKSKVLAVPKIKPAPDFLQSSINLTSLQALLDRHLQDVISANMGDGTERRVLNYRTGRFAASAKVERLSQSREGMITAFYSYMKNPYQTFQPGFRQGSPKTRDPRTLISTSIREIAATVVGNKLRAVSI